MIQLILELLKSDDFFGVSEIVDVAKGKHELTGNLKKADWFENELIDELISLFPNKDYDSASSKVTDYIKDKIK